MTQSPVPSRPRRVNPAEREAMIREAAYYLAEKHNFDPRFDQENWLEATREIDALLAERGQI
ncbi:MAG: DUF2934 domain-containing protein [Gammaproteobacteria bacterium]|nr:DUF2934 domain-containing protein [Gammaproteobacteria bacterium]